MQRPCSAVPVTPLRICRVVAEVGAESWQARLHRRMMQTQRSRRLADAARCEKRIEDPDILAVCREMRDGDDVRVSVE